MSSPIAQSALVGGELAPSLYGRVDLARYTQSAKVIENFVVDPHGGASNRQGSKFVAYSKLQDGSQVRLIPFEPSADESYVLEFGHKYLRIHTQYGPVYTAAFPIIASNNDETDAHVTFNFLDEPPHGGVSQLRQSQSFVTPAGGPLVIEKFGVRMSRSTSVSAPPALHGAIYASAANVPTAPLAGAGFADFTPPLPTDPGTSTAPFVYFTLHTPITLAASTEYHFVIESDHPPASPFAGQAIFMTNDSRYLNPAATGRARYWNGAAWVLLSDTLDWCFVLNGPDSTLLDLVTPYESLPMDDLGTESELTQLVVTQSVDVMTIVQQNHPPYELKRYGEGSWTFLPLGLQTATGKPTAISFAGPNGHIPATTPTKKWTYAVAGVSRDGIESEPLISAEINCGVMTDTDFVTMVITGTETVDHYSVYKGRNGTYGFIGVTKMRADLTEVWDYTYNSVFPVRYEYWRDLQAGASGTHSEQRPSNHRDWRDDNKYIRDLADVDARAAADKAVAALTAGVNSYLFDDENQSPDYTDQPRRFINPFADQVGGRKPAVTTYFQQRQVFANWLGQPDTIAMSETADYKNFQRSLPTVDDDSIEATLAAGQLNSIKAAVALRSLFLFTSGAEFVLGSQNGPVSPSNIDSLPVSRRGSGTLQPLVIGSVLLFVDRAGRVREWLYEQTSNDYPATDVGLLAAHLFDLEYITAWTYVEAPRSVVWATRTDGTLLTFTYVREQSVAAWARQTTAGKFRDVCHIREFGERGDTPWVIAQRTINGVAATIIEKFPPRNPASSVFLDCHATADYEEVGNLELDLTSPGAPGTIVDGILLGTVGWLKTNWVHVHNATLVATTASLANAPGVRFVVDGEIYSGHVVKLDDPAHTGSSTSYWIELDRDIPASVYAVIPVVLAEWECTAKVWRGFDHLIGETVGVVADDSVHPDLVVSGGGAVTLNTYAAKVSVGLRYISTLKLLPLVAGGSEIRAKQKLINSVDLVVADTRGIWVGEKDTDMTEKKPEYPDTTDERTDTITCRASSTWGKSGAQTIQQRDPVPCTILAIIPEVTLGG